MANAIDLAMVYKFLRSLVLPFDKWNAYKQGVIDGDGNIIVPPKKRSVTQQRSFMKFDLLVLKLKKLLAKVPGGKSRLATYAAALWLIKEDQSDRNPDEITDEILQEEVDACMEEVQIELIEDAPVNAVGGGHIAAVGIGPQGEPPGKKKKKKVMPPPFSAMVKR